MSHAAGTVVSASVMASHTSGPAVCQQLQRVLDAGSPRSSDTAATGLHDVGSPAGGQSRCGVRAGVRCHHDHDGRRRRLRGGRVQTPQTGSDAVFFVVRGDDDGHS